MLTPEVHGKLETTEVKVQKYLRKKHSDGRKLEVKEFDERLPTMKEFTLVLRKTRNRSVPGPNGIPYKVYKKCPSVARLLWLYLRALWMKGIINSRWIKAEYSYQKKMKQ